MTTKTPTQIALPELTADLDLDDAEAVAAAEQAEQDAVGEHVVAFGCQSADRVFLAAVPGQRRVAYVLPVPKCPGCGSEHEIRALPRPRRPRDEIAITVEPAAETPKRSKKSDTDVLAALSETAWMTIPELAGHLGLTSHAALADRLRQMRRRGQPIVILTPETIVCRIGDAPLPPTPAGHATDVEIRAQIGADWKPAADVADAVGVARKRLAPRLRRMEEFECEVQRHGSVSRLFVRKVKSTP